MGRFFWAWCFSWLLVLAFVASARAEDSLLTPVCVIPQGVPEDVARNGWIFGPSGSTVVRMRREEFKKKAQGQMVYVYNPAAPPENTKKLPIAYHHLPCTPDPSPPAPPAAPSTNPTAGPPLPPAAGGASGDAPKAAKQKPAQSQESEAPPDLPEPIVYPKNDPDPKPQPPRHGVTTHWPATVLPVVRSQTDTRTKVLPPAGTVLPIVRPDVDTQTKVLPTKPLLPMADRSGKPGGSGGDSDAPIKVDKKSGFEKLAEELAYGGAIATGQLNEDTKRPDGKQYGIPGGKNATGPNNPVVQAAAGAVLVVAAVLSAGTGGFRKKFVEALKKGKPLAFKEMAELGEEGAEELVQALVKAKGKDGRAYLAQALSGTGTIGPYSVMRKFTDQLGGRFQAHHILEEQFIKKFKLGKPDLGPSVILTDAEHKAITAKLSTKTVGAKTPKDLWAKYQDVYADHPEWLKAIESYFTTGK